MSFKNILVLILFLSFFVTGCITEKGLYHYDGTYEITQEGTTLATLDLSKKRKRIVTYPSLKFTETIMLFHEKLGRYPKSIIELGDLDPKNRALIQNMMSSNYRTLQIIFSQQNSMIIKYEYSKFTARELEQLKKNSSRLYVGKYIYMNKDGKTYVKNVPGKQPLIKVSRP